MWFNRAPSASLEETADKVRSSIGALRRREETLVSDLHEHLQAAKAARANGQNAIAAGHMQRYKTTEERLGQVRSRISTLEQAEFQVEQTAWDSDSIDVLKAVSESVTQATAKTNTEAVLRMQEKLALAREEQTLVARALGGSTTQTKEADLLDELDQLDVKLAPPSATASAATSSAASRAALHDW